MIFERKNNSVSVLLVILIVVFIGACNSESNRQNKPVDNGLQKESLEKANRYLVNSEEREINNYVKRHNLDVKETGSGVLYEIINNGKGEKAKEGKIITLDYILKLITGDVVYSSDSEGAMIFEIGHGGVVSGLEEAILNLRQGDEAIIIIPSHLAFGLKGDENKIPGRSTIIFELKVTNIK